METKHMTVELFEAIDNESLELLKGGKARILKTEFEVAKDGDGSVIGNCCNGKKDDRKGVVICNPFYGVCGNNTCKY